MRLVLVTHSFTCKKKYVHNYTHTHMIEREGGFDMINLGFLSIDGQRTVHSCMFVHVYIILLFYIRTSRVPSLETGKI